MKTLIYVSLFSSLLLGSCSKDALNPMDSTNSTGTVVERAVVTSNTPLPFTTKYDLAKANASGARSGLPDKKFNFTEIGPFTVTGNLRQIFTNRKTTLTTNQSLYAPGIYFCNIYVDDYTVTIPQGAIFNFISASKTGYSDFTNQTSGINVTQTVNANGSSSYNMATNSMIPQTASNGQEVNHYTLPQDLTGTTYTYSYLVR